MPTGISLFEMGVWFMVGLCTGLGWALASVIVGRVIR